MTMTRTRSSTTTSNHHNHNNNNNNSSPDNAVWEALFNGKMMENAFCPPGLSVGFRGHVRPVRPAVSWCDSMGCQSFPAMFSCPAGFWHDTWLLSMGFTWFHAANHPHHLGLSGRCFTISQVSLVFDGCWQSLHVEMMFWAPRFRWVSRRDRALKVYPSRPEMSRRSEYTTTSLRCHQTWLHGKLPFSLMIFPFFMTAMGKNLRAPSHPPIRLTKRMGGATVLEGTWGLGRTLHETSNPAENQHLDEEICWICLRIF